MHRERRVANYLFVLYASASLLILSLPLAGPILSVKACMAYLWSPAAFFGAHSIDGLSGVPPRIAHLIAADSENHALRDELKQLSWAESQMTSLRRENERLRKALEIKPAHGHILRWARVMERDPANWYRYLVIDEGKEDGIELNAPVLGVQNGRLGAIGRITEFGPNWAKVLLITDELSS